MRIFPIISVVVGIALTGIGGAQLRTRAHGNLDPVIRTLDDLAAPDALENFHVTVADFRPGSVLIVKASKGRKNAWAPLLRPDGTWPARPVFAFLPGVADPIEAARTLQQGEVTGILGDSLPGSARDFLAVRYPDVDLAQAISVRVGGALPSLALHLTLFVVGLILLVGGAIVAMTSTWGLTGERPKPQPAGAARS